MPTIGRARPTEDQLVAFATLLGRSGKIIESEISGTSMGSTLPAGRRIRIQPLPFNSCRPGQVVAFVSGNKVFAHRIVCCTRQGALTRGDNRALCDLPVPTRAILGLVTESQLDGQWCPLADCASFPREKQRRRQSAEFLLRLSMRIDIRLARFLSRALMALVLSRHRLLNRAMRSSSIPMRCTCARWRSNYSVARLKKEAPERVY